MPRPELPEEDGIDRFMAEHHDHYAALIEEGRLSAEQGEAEPMSSLEELLAEARGAYSRQA